MSNYLLLDKDDNATHNQRPWFSCPDMNSGVRDGGRDRHRGHDLITNQGMTDMLAKVDTGKYFKIYFVIILNVLGQYSTKN